MLQQCGDTATISRLVQSMSARSKRFKPWTHGVKLNKKLGAGLIVMSQEIIEGLS